jgi:hypothetical protein
MQVMSAFNFPVKQENRGFQVTLIDNNNNQNVINTLLQEAQEAGYELIRQEKEELPLYSDIGKIKYHYYFK